MKKIYRLEKVNKIYNNISGKQHALKNIDLEINEGDIVVILGPSGSGKSTILNLLSGIDNPTNGKIYFNNSRIDKYNEEQLTQYRSDNLGFIFQSYNLISNLTARENIELGLTGDNNLSMKQVIDIIDLNDHINKYPYQLSGGQMQRISIARAIIKNPKVIFCDEPTGALDEKSGKRILKALQDINEQYYTTIVIVTHNPSIAEMANVVIKMNSGEIAEIKINKEIKKAKDLRWA